jgi:hypothetical protein
MTHFPFMEEPIVPTLADEYPIEVAEEFTRGFVPA